LLRPEPEPCRQRCIERVPPRDRRAPSARAASRRAGPCSSELFSMVLIR
jgi:hypothetical protein